MNTIYKTTKEYVEVTLFSEILKASKPKKLTEKVTLHNFFPAGVTEKMERDMLRVYERQIEIKFNVKITQFIRKPVTEIIDRIVTLIQIRQKYPGSFKR